MDCRKPLALALGFLAGASGCSHHSAAVPAPPPAPAAVTAAKTDALDPDALKRPPRPETFVAYGDFSAREAALAKEPAEQEALRDRARRAYQEAIKTDADYLPAHKALARLYAAMNDVARAKAEFETALKQAPDDASLWFDLGMTYARAKEWAPAAEHLAKAAELDPENRPYARYLGFTLARAGRYDESLAAFARHEGEAKAHYHVAQMLEHVGKVEESKSHLQKALARDPQLADAARMLVRLTGPAPAAPAVQPVGYTEPAAAPAAETTRRRLLPPPPALPADLGDEGTAKN